MQEQVHLRNRGVLDVLLLSEDLPQAELRILHVVNRLDEHAARAASGIVDTFAGLGIEDAHQQLHHRPWRVELAGLRLGLIREALEQDFVGIAHQVCGIVLVAELAG